MGILGIEASEACGNMDWQREKERGAAFAMLRAGYGTGSVDVQFRRNAAACNRLGILCGAYWHSYAYTPQMAAREAERCAETVEEFALACPLGIKLGRASARYARSKGITLTEGLAADIVAAFCVRARELGYASARYRNLDSVKGYFAMPQ